VDTGPHEAHAGAFTLRNVRCSGRTQRQSQVA